MSERELNVKCNTDVGTAGATAPKSLFCHPTPGRLRDVLFQARMDSLRTFGITETPGEEPLNPLDVSIDILHGYTTDDASVLQNMMQQVEAEKVAAGERAHSGQPHPQRRDELGTMPAMEGMRILGGLFAWSTELDDSLALCMLEAGEYVINLYCKLEDEAA